MLVFQGGKKFCASFWALLLQPPPQALRFSHGRGERETSDWWWTARDHGKGRDGSCLLPAFLCAHIFIKRETSGYGADHANHAYELRETELWYIPCIFCEQGSVEGGTVVHRCMQHVRWSKGWATGYNRRGGVRGTGASLSAGFRQFFLVNRRGSIPF